MMKKYLLFLFLSATFFLFSGCQSTSIDKINIDAPDAVNSTENTEFVNLKDTIFFDEKTALVHAIDTIVFDIDKDGKEETCVLGFGPTSGLFTFTLTVIETRDVEYYHIYESAPYQLSFDVKDDVLRLKGVARGENPKTDYFNFFIENGNIVLSNDVQKLDFWG